MKKLLCLFFVIVLCVALKSCRKGEQPLFINVEILKRTGQEIVNQEDRIDKDRGSYNPSAYDSLAKVATDKVWAVLMIELKPDTFYSKKGDIALVVMKYDEYWRKKHPKYQSEVWPRLDVGVQIDVYRVCTYYSDQLLRRLKSYCEATVNGSPEWTEGVRNKEEMEIRNLFIYDPDPAVNWGHYDRLYSYFKDFANNPNSKAKYRRNGFMNFGWGN